MKKDNFYKLIIICLLSLNIGMLAFLWLGHRGGPTHNSRPDHLIIERLKLDEKQRQQFEALKQEHHSQIITIQEDGGKLHDELFSQLGKEPEDTVRENSLLAQIQNNELQKERVTLGHFRKLRAILRSDQLPLFDDFISELSRQLMGPPGPPREGPLPGRP